jgi:hypothetical protein
MATKRLLLSLLFVLVMACSNGSDGGGPTGPAGLTLGSLVGTWNITLNLIDDSCGFGAPAELIDEWEFAASPDEIPSFVSDGEFYNAAFDNASGSLTFTAEGEGVTITFDGRFTTATRFSGTFEAVREGCTISYSVDANKFGA